MPKAKRHQLSKLRRGFRNRLILVCGSLCLCTIALVAKLFYLQILQHDTLLLQSEKQYGHPAKIVYGRGKILDRNLNELATNLEVESVYIHPRDVPDKTYTAQMLAATLDLDLNKVLRMVSSKKSFVWVKRKSALKETAKLKRLHLPGVRFTAEHKRFYPKRELAANLIGFVGVDNQGLAGVEHYYDSILKGLTLFEVIEKDARGKNLPSIRKNNDLSNQSADVVLTLDEVIQFITEYQLKKQVQKYRAKGGIAVVMAPATGEIYAMAAIPQYNPNNYNAYPAELWKNPAISSAFEPGSIFKPIVAAAAIQTGVAGPNDIFFCENGAYIVGNTRIGEAANHRFGWLTLRNIIAKSSNIGVIKVAEKLGPAHLYHHIKKFGFGGKVGINLPGEATGKVRDLSKWSKLSLASISFGQEIAVTPIQMITAFSAIANGGNLMRPYVTKAIRRNGKTIQSFGPMVIQRVISEKTSHQMVEILKSVIKTGTAPKAAIPGFEVAGKTGTAQKFDTVNQAYSKTAFMASFIGFVPADAPQLAILVMIDEPQTNYWGSDVAAPVFREIAKQTLRYLNLPSSEEHIFILDRA